MAKKESPRVNNLVAKHSRNKSGSGPHKSKKDYRRKSKKNDKLEGDQDVQV